MTKPTSIRLVGRKFSVSGKGDYFEGLTEGFDDPVIRFLERSVVSDAVCIDVGSNIGITTLALSALAPRGRVLAIEPNHETFQFLADNTRAMANVTTVNSLVGQSGQERIFYRNGMNPACSVSSAMDRPILHNNPVHTPEVLNCASLDDLVTRHGFENADMVKIDTEGFDLEVLLSAPRLREKRQAIFVIEFSAHTLMNFGAINPPEALRQIMAMFPHVARLEASGGISPITDPYAFMYAHVLQRSCLDNLVCSFHKIQHGHP